MQFANIFSNCVILEKVLNSVFSKQFLMLGEVQFINFYLMNYAFDVIFKKSLHKPKL